VTTIPACADAEPFDRLPARVVRHQEPDEEEEENEEDDNEDDDDDDTTDDG
jgi:hypothetical protein